MEYFLLFACLLLSGGAAAAFFYRATRETRAVRDAWQKVANHYHLPYTGELLAWRHSFAGVLDEFHLTASCAPRPQPGKERAETVRTKVQMRFPAPLELGLRVVRADFLPPEHEDAPGRALVRFDEHEDFAVNFVVEALKVEECRRFLERELRDRLLSYDRSAELFLDDNGLSYEQAGAIASATRLREIVDGQLWIARAFWSRKGELDLEREPMP